MKELTPEQIQSNWNKLRQIISDTFDGERLENLNKMYDYFEDRMVIAPASGKEHYHNAMVGGYVEHVLHVVGFSLQLKEVWERNGATIDFTDEELIFATMHHDLGKVGDLDHDYYILNESEWHRKNQGKIFVHNPELQFMTVTDRALWLLQHFNIPMSQTEYLGLRLTDGMYEKANKDYYMGYGELKNLKTNLPYLLHTADMLATRWEKEQYMFGKDSDINYSEVLHPELKEEREKQETESVNNIKEAVSKNETPEILSQKSKDLFDELFGDK